MMHMPNKSPTARRTRHSCVLRLPFSEPCEPDRARLAQMLLALDPWEAEGYIDAQLPLLVDAVCDLSTYWEKGDCSALPDTLERVRKGGLALGLTKIDQVVTDVTDALACADEAALGATMARLFRLLEAAFDAFSFP